MGPSERMVEGMLGGNGRKLRNLDPEPPQTGGADANQPRGLGVTAGGEVLEPLADEDTRRKRIEVDHGGSIAASSGPAAGPAPRSSRRPAAPKTPQPPPLTLLPSA